MYLPSVVRLVRFVDAAAALPAIKAKINADAQSECLSWSTIRPELSVSAVSSIKSGV